MADPDSDSGKKSDPDPEKRTRIQNTVLASLSTVAKKLNTYTGFFALLEMLNTKLKNGAVAKMVDWKEQYLSYILGCQTQKEPFFNIYHYTSTRCLPTDFSSFGSLIIVMGLMACKSAGLPRCRR